MPLMIFAAGFGRRMGALTADRPKPLIALAGRTLIDRAIDLGEAAGCAPIVVNTHYRAGMLAPVLAARGVAVSHETPQILDTGGGLKRALPLLGPGRIRTLNPDAGWQGPNPLAVLAASPWPEGAGALLLLVPDKRAHARTAPGDFDRAPDGTLTRRGPYVYSGAQIIDAAEVAAEPGAVFSLNAVWTRLAAEGRLYGAIYPGHWCDIGHPAGLTTAETLLASPA